MTEDGLLTIASDKPYWTLLRKVWYIDTIESVINVLLDIFNKTANYTLPNYIFQAEICVKRKGGSTECVQTVMVPSYCI